LTVFLLFIYPREEDNIMNIIQRTPDQWNRYGVILVTQARELAEKLGQPVPTLKNVKMDDRAAVLDAVSDAHELLADVWMKIPSEVDPVDWERTKVEDGRTGEEIWTRLDDVMHELLLQGKALTRCFTGSR
jgi:hypothetical protein